MQFDSKHKEKIWPWIDGEQDSDYAISSSWPRLSIITPSYNQGKYIEETIRSVLLQGYPNLEYIIIDGGSSDNTVEIIKRYETQLAYWISEPDRGQSHAINKGLQRATGEIIAWLNADDIYLPNALHTIAKVFMEHNPKWVVGITVLTDAALKEIDRFIPQVTTGIWKSKNYKTQGWLDFVFTHQSGTALPQPSSFWSRDIVLQAGGVNESYKYALDHDLYGRMAYAGNRPLLIPQSIACFRVHQQQKTEQFPYVFWQEELDSIHLWQQKELPLAEKRALESYEEWFRRFIAIQKIKEVTPFSGVIFFLRRSIKLLRTLVRTYRKRQEQKGIVSKKIIAKYLPKNPVIIEAGAHIGLDTEELAKEFPKGCIYAFEPIPNLFFHLSERTRPYKNIRCFPLAIGDKEGEATMYISGGASDGSSSLLYPKDHLVDHPDVSFNETMRVPCITLDKWAESNGINKVDMLWLDMQGFELAALKSSQKILENVRVIYTEVNLKEEYDGAPLYSELREWLMMHGFNVVREEIPWEDGGNVLFIRR